MNQDWLEWLVGYCDQQKASPLHPPIYGTYFRNECFSINVTNEDNLNNLKECLQLNSSVRSRGTDKCNLTIAGASYFKVLGSILHKNMINIEAVSKFNTYIKILST